MNKKLFSKTKVKKEQAGLRLDTFLAQSFAKTRSQWQKLIKSGQVKVNQKIVSNHCWLKEGDIITGEEISAKALARPQALLKKIKIIKETPDYLILDKPAGLTVHPTPTSTDFTLADWLKEKYPNIAKVGENPWRPGIVHRLDKNVSGLMVVARTQASFLDLKKQFKSRKITKQYQALTYGQFSQPFGAIDFPIKRSKTGKMSARTQEQSGKSALTEFEVLKQYVNYSLVQLTIKTGRTHQIRVHLAAYNHPIVGDNLYCTKTTKTKNQQLGLERLFLVAVKLGFKDLAKEPQEFKLKLPKELQEFLAKVR